MARTSFLLVLLGISGAVSMALALIGVYGVLAFAVAERRREVSIRIALGARPREVKELFLRRGMKLAGIGILLGAIAAAGLSRGLKALLFGVTAGDPATYLAVASIVCGAALIASYIPARRAAAVDPAEFLRAE